MKIPFSTLPRLYSSHFLQAGGETPLDARQAHYLTNVLRFEEGERFRIFNETQGEWLAEITIASKKACHARCLDWLRPPPPPQPALALAFSPLRKHRLDILVEKATELGVTSLNPVFCDRTENRGLRAEKMLHQVIEAAEQSERLSLPSILAPVALEKFLASQPCPLPLYVCYENSLQKPFCFGKGSPEQGATFLVGPEGGFTPQEVALFNKYPFVKIISLGPLILRSETAAIAVLAAYQYHLQNRKDMP